jgi:hypothetical protein
MVTRARASGEAFARDLLVRRRLQDEAALF